MTAKKGSTESKAKTMYVNLKRVTMSGGKRRGQTFEAKACKDDLGHLSPAQIRILLNQRVWEVAE